MNEPNATERRRVVRTTLAMAWDGSDALSKEIHDHQGLAQHQLSIGFNADPSGGALRVEGRPVGSNFYVAVSGALTALDVSDTGSVAVFFKGYFDAIRLSFTTALDGASSVKAMLHSSGEDLYITSGDVP